MLLDPERGLWVVYNEPHPGRSDFDVMALRLGCSPAEDVAPFLVDDAPEANDVDPSVARVGDRLMVLWQSDLPDRDPNLWLRWRLLDRDGAPVGPSTRLVTTEPATVHWMGSVAGDADAFVVAGARALPLFRSFTVFAQRVDPAGELVGPILRDERDTDGQVEPTVGVTEGGEARIAWLEGGQTGKLMRAQVTAEELSPRPAEMVTEMSTSQVRYDRAGHWLVATVERGTISVALWSGAIDADAAPTHFGPPGVNVSPAVASEPGGAGGLVAWFRPSSGFRGPPAYQAFDAEGAPVGEPRIIESSSEAAAYPMALAALGDGRYFLAWAEGTSPEFRLKGRFVRR